jgi:hypothetical protein
VVDQGHGGGGDGEEPRGGPSRRSIAGLAVIIVLALIGWFLVRELQSKAKLEDCLMSGRRDCAPITAN